MEIAKRIINIILVLLTIIIIILNLYVFYSKIVLKKDVIKIFNYAAMVIVSGSMEPELEVDDLIIIKEDEYEEQDIVTFKEGKSFVTHRIIKINGDEILTKGDSNNTVDQPIKKSQIQGKVVYRISKVGKVTRFVTSPIGILIFITLIFLIIRKTDKTKEGENSEKRKTCK